tara:strand:+ start:83 stop:2122 length:2040 start_codon:yes stop_codon:yes gene_type:complete
MRIFPRLGVSDARSASDPYYFSKGLLVLDANEGVLKTGGSAAGYLDTVAAWQNKAIGPKNFLFMPGTVYSYAYVSHNSNLNAFDDFCFEVNDVLMPDWTPSNHTPLISKTYPSYGYASWEFGVDTDGKLRIDLSFDGTNVTTYKSTVATGVSDGGTCSVRAIRNSSTISFEIDTGSGFAALGTTVAGVSTTLYDSVYSNLEIGNKEGGSYSYPLKGQVGGAKVYNTATPDSSSPVFSVDFSLATRTDRSFAVTTGQTIYLQGDGVAIQQATASDAVQTTYSYRGKYLTPSANNLPVGHFPGVGSNFYSVPDAANLDGWGDFTIEAKGVTLTDWTPSSNMGLVSKWTSSGAQRSWRFDLKTNGKLILYLSFNGSSNTGYESTSSTGLSNDSTADLMVMRNGTDVKFYVNGVQLGTDKTAVTTSVASKSAPVRLGMAYNTTGSPLTGKYTRARVWNSAVANPANPTESPILDVNFEVDATHGDSSFTATTGQTVTVNTSGDNPCSVIGYPVIRFDGVDNYLSGHFIPSLTKGRLFVVGTILGGGGESHARVFNVTKDTDSVTASTTGAGLIIREVATSDWWSYHNGSAAVEQSGKYTGRILAQVDFSASSQSSKTNDANLQTATADWSGLNSNKYAIAGGADNGNWNSAIDVEFVALYPDSMSDSEAASVVAILNERFKIY